MLKILPKKLIQIFADTCKPARAHARDLIIELEKSADEINEEKCLKLIQKGIDCRYNNWPPRNISKLHQESLEAMANAASNHFDAIPSNPKAVILASEKGQMNILSALLKTNKFHPGQWDMQSGLTAKIAAAQNIQIDIIKKLNESIASLRVSSLPQLTREDFDKMSIEDHRNLRAKSDKHKAWIATLNHKDINGKNFSDYVKETGNDEMLRAIRIDEFIDWTSEIDLRPTDAGFEDEWKKLQTEIEQEIEKMKALKPEHQRKTTHTKHAPLS